MEELRGWRKQIDKIDDQIIDLLAERFGICRQVAAYKHPRNIPVRLADRIAEVHDRCVARAVSHKISAKFAGRLYDQIIEETCQTEERLMAGWESQNTLKVLT